MPDDILAFFIKYGILLFILLVVISVFDAMDAPLTKNRIFDIFYDVLTTTAVIFLIAVVIFLFI